jgi:hypothetical protein
MRCSLFVVLGLAASTLPISALAASETSSVTIERPSIEAVMIDPKDAPRIDGDISDAVWSRGAHITRFVQMDPVPLSEPTERTEVWILYDRNKLYIAAYSHYRNIRDITATTMERDIPLFSDDTIRISLDPRRTHRSQGYFFEMNAVGSRSDVLMLGNNQLAPSWNMLWQGKSKKVEDGWTVEFALPFRGLSYDSDSSSWSMDIVREFKRNSEIDRWSPTPPGTFPTDASYAGDLNGLHGMTQGNGLDILAYEQVRYTRDWTNGNDSVTTKPSATAYYKITPALNGLVTLNTDFADTPLDTRQVNTTRFSLFQPETRDFFLQDADIFEFANFGSSEPNARPFFSRNIGLVNGQSVNMDAGAKLSGNIGDLRIGALTVRTGSDGTNAAQTLSIARLTTKVLDESQVGAIVTAGDPTGATNNRLAGVDFQYRNSQFGPNKLLTGMAYIERSFSNSVGSDNTFGAELLYPNQPWGGTFRFKQVGADFSPALGFINRPDIRSWNEEVVHVWRLSDSRLRKITANVTSLRVTDLDNRPQSNDDWVAVQFEDRRNNRLKLGVHSFMESLSAPFTMPGNDNAIVPAGRYKYTRGTADLQTDQSRPLSLHWTVACCDYYNGTSTESDIQVNYRPNPNYSLQFNHHLQPIDLPNDIRTSIHIESLNGTVNFTPEMKLVTELQYDNVSKRFGGSIRYRWEITPLTELLVTLAESALLDGPWQGGTSYHSQASAAAVRIGHRFQY